MSSSWSLSPALSLLYLLQSGKIAPGICCFLSSTGAKIVIGSIALALIGAQLYSIFNQPSIYFSRIKNLRPSYSDLESSSTSLEHQPDYKTDFNKDHHPNDSPPFLFIDENFNDQQEMDEDDPLYRNYSHDPINMESITSRADLSQALNTQWSNLTKQQLIEYIDRISKNEVKVFDKEKIQWVTKQHIESFIMSLSEDDKDIFLGQVLKLGGVYILDFAKIFSMEDFEGTLELALKRDKLQEQFINYINYYYSNIIKVYHKSKELSSKSIFHLLEEKFQTISNQQVIYKLVNSSFFSGYDLNDLQKYPDLNYQTFNNFIDQSTPLQRYLIYAHILQMLPAQSQQLHKNPLKYRVFHYTLEQLTKRLINLFSGVDLNYLSDHQGLLKIKESKYKTLEQMESVFINLDQAQALELVLSSTIFLYHDIRSEVKNSWRRVYKLLKKLINNSSDLNKHILFSIFFNLDDSSIDDIAKIYQLSKPKILYLKKVLAEDIFQTFFPDSNLGDAREPGELQSRESEYSIEDELAELQLIFDRLSETKLINKFILSPIFKDIDLRDHKNFSNFSYENLTSIIDQSPPLNKHIILSIILDLDSTIAADIARLHKTTPMSVSSTKKLIVKQMLETFSLNKTTIVMTLAQLIKAYEEMSESEVINRLVQSQYLSHLDLSNHKKYPNINYQSLTTLIDKVYDIKKHVILSNILNLDSAENIHIRQLYSLSDKFFISEIRRQVIKSMQYLFSQNVQIAYGQSLTLPQLQSIYDKLSDTEVMDKILHSSVFKEINLSDRIIFPNFNRKTLNILIESATPIKKHVIFSVLLNLDANRITELSKIYSVTISAVSSQKKDIKTTLLKMFM